MKIGVIGEPCIDLIHFPDGKTLKSKGGILYSLISMSVLADKDDIVFPVFNIGNDEYDNLGAYLSEFENIEQRYIRKVEHKTRMVKLFYSTDKLNDNKTKSANHPRTYDREESSTEPTFPVEYEWIEPALKEIDALLINMVSGVDITLDTLKMIRNNFKGYIHMDIHNIVMRTDEHGCRTRGFLPDWMDWCINCNTLQMNESELRAIGNKIKTEEEIVSEIVNVNKSGYPEAVIVTRGKFGVTLYYNENGGIKRFEEAPIIRANSSDPTGCGDTFASAFLISNMKNQGDHKSSLKFANNIASAKATLRGVNELNNLKNVI
jgi:sugar/nucleoside kinase (ribokinase family)